MKPTLSKASGLHRASTALLRCSVLAVVVLSSPHIILGQGSEGQQPEGPADVAKVTPLQPLPEVEPLDPVTALKEGNNLFRGGRLEEAAATFRRGWDPDLPHPLLAYNLGTTLHHLDRLPEAILWYRRAEGSPDPWLEENLDLARRTLGAPRSPEPGWLATLAAHKGILGTAAVLFAWMTPILLAVPWRHRRMLAGVLGAVALLLGGATLGVQHLAPIEVVVLEDCRGPGGELPAGTEAWAEPTSDGWRLSGLDLSCSVSQLAAIRSSAPVLSTER